jgi:antitoxin (DNA-binding transcriptional repressor) of toxin-antitoxin stability system
MIKDMATVHMSEDEVVKDIAAVLAKVRQGLEVVVEQDRRTVAVIRPPQRPGRKLSECIALAKAYEEKLGYAPMPDAEFSKDVAAVINANRQPFEPPSWD